MFGSTESERLLSQLFAQKYGTDGGAEAARFLASLEGVKLPFDLTEQIRCRDYPPCGENTGMPSIFYYFVPDTGRGSEKEFPKHALDPTFAETTDGFGQNFGCPLRLKRAIEILTRMQPDDKAECLSKLSEPMPHLAAVEEILWLDAWKAPSNISRSEGTPGRTHDWRFLHSGIPIRFECKFFPSDWPRLVDGPIHEPIKGSIFKKAAKQLPNPPHEGDINVVGLTGMAHMTDQFRAFCRDNLRAHPNIHALIYRNYAMQTSVLSLNERCAQIVHSMLTRFSPDEFQLFYFVVSNRIEGGRRDKVRGGTAGSAFPSDASGLFELPVDSHPPKKYLTPQRWAYRYEIQERLPSGEPVFSYVPPEEPVE